MDQDGSYGVGDRLRQARETRGLSLDDVATQTRIPIRHLSNIEDGNWNELPSITYTVGFARSYANAVGLDGAAIGRELRGQVSGEARPSRMSPEIYAPPNPARVPSRSLTWIAGIALLVLIALWLLVLRPWLTRSDDELAETPAAAQPAATQAQPTQPQPAAPQNLAGQPVTLVATGDVWMHVNDAATNRRLYFGTLKSGDRFAVPADASRPVMVLTTNPQNLRATIGDQDRGPLAPARRRMTNQSLRAEDLAGAVGQQPGQPPAPAGQPAG